MESFKSAWNNIFRQRSRSILTIFGIAIGVFSVVLIGTISDIGKTVINNELSSMGIDGLTVSSTSNIGCTLSEEKLNVIKSADIVLDATPLLFTYSNVYSRGEKEKTIIMGIDSNANEIISLTPLYGRLIDRADVKGYRDVCVVDEAFAQSAYHRSNIVGKKIQVELEGKPVSFEVVGVVKTGGSLIQNMIGSYVPSFIYLPYSTQWIYTGTDDFDQIAVKLKKGEDTAAAQAVIDRIMNTGLDGESTVRIDNLSGYKDELNSVLNGVSAILGIIAGISLVVAGLSIMTVMLVSVNERTREIGIKKSIGASSGRIIREFMIEALFLSLLGSVVGCVAGVLVGGAGSLLMGMGFLFNGTLIAVCVAFSILIGVIFGVYPALKASRLKPAEALRRE